MNNSFEGIGQWAATFSCTGVREEDLVEISGNGQVKACAAGKPFCGQAVSVGRGGDACSVQLGGFITAGYSGTAPALGYAALSADGSGGVKTDAAGRTYLVAQVDTGAKTVTFVL